MPISEIVNTGTRRPRWATGIPRLQIPYEIRSALHVDQDISLNKGAYFKPVKARPNAEIVAARWSANWRPKNTRTRENSCPASALDP